MATPLGAGFAPALGRRSTRLRLIGGFLTRNVDAPWGDSGGNLFFITTTPRHQCEPADLLIPIAPSVLARIRRTVQPDHGSGRFAGGVYRHSQRHLWQSPDRAAPITLSVAGWFVRAHCHRAVVRAAQRWVFTAMPDVGVRHDRCFAASGRRGCWAQYPGARRRI